MRTATHDTFGEPSEVLKSTDVPAPEAGPGEVLVRTILSPIHNHDLWTIQGVYGYKPTLPAIGGSEAVGIVEATGEGVEDGLMGKRVAVAGAHGTWAELFVAKAATVIPLPASISDELGSQLIAMPFSAISLLESLELSEGDWLIQNSANGAVGKVLAVLAKTRGIHVINLVRREGAVADLEALGIENIVVTEGSWKDEVRALTGEAGARAAVDSIGGAAAADLTDVLGFEATLVSFGSATGEPLALHSGTLIFKQLTVRGFWGTKASQAMSASDKTRLFGELITMATKGELSLPIGDTFSLEEAAEAAAAARAVGRKGKILLRP